MEIVDEIVYQLSPSDLIFVISYFNVSKRDRALRLNKQ
jgi:hypothetical protein